MNEVDPNGINQHAAGAKLDSGKIDMSLLCLWPRALKEICRVGTMGASKYSRGGFLSVANGYLRYTAALLRHLFKESFSTMDDDPYYDTPSGAPYKGRIRHDAQVAWNALSRLEVKLIEEEKNNNGLDITAKYPSTGGLAQVTSGYIQPEWPTDFKPYPGAVVSGKATAGPYYGPSVAN